MIHMPLGRGILKTGLRAQGDRSSPQKEGGGVVKGARVTGQFKEGSRKGAPTTSPRLFSSVRAMEVTRGAVARLRCLTSDAVPFLGQRPGLRVSHLDKAPEGGRPPGRGGGPPEVLAPVGPRGCWPSTGTRGIPQHKTRTVSRMCPWLCRWV